MARLHGVVFIRIGRMCVFTLHTRTLCIDYFRIASHIHEKLIHVCLKTLTSIGRRMCMYLYMNIYTYICSGVIVYVFAHTSTHILVVMFSQCPRVFLLSHLYLQSGLFRPVKPLYFHCRYGQFCLCLSPLPLFFCAF